MPYSKRIYLHEDFQIDTIRVVSCINESWQDGLYILGYLRFLVTDGVLHHRYSYYYRMWSYGCLSSNMLAPSSIHIKIEE